MLTLGAKSGLVEQVPGKVQQVPGHLLGLAPGSSTPVLGQLQPWEAAFNPEEWRETGNFRPRGRITGLACSGRFGPVLQRNPYPGAWWQTLVVVVSMVQLVVVYTPPVHQPIIYTDPS